VAMAPRRRWIATCLSRRNEWKDFKEVDQTDRRVVHESVEEAAAKEDDLAPKPEESAQDAEELEMAKATAQLEEKLRDFVNLDVGNRGQELDFPDEEDYRNVSGADTENLIP
jgi:hypothetical protein